MHTIFLTSGGVRFAPIADEFIKLLPCKPKDVKLAHIITASKMAKDLTYLKEDKEAFHKLDIIYEDLDIEEMTEERHREVIKEGSKHTKYQVRILTDKQALLIQTGAVTLVGDGEEVKV